MSGHESAVVLDDAGKQFDDTWILRNIDLQVESGSILGLIGPSGCGKTSTVRLITGVLSPDEGSVQVLGATPSRLGRTNRQRLGYLPQDPVLFRSLSLWENLQYHASLNGMRMRGRGKRLHQLLELVDLEGDESTTVENASGGMRRRTALAAALLHEPQLLLLDEPTAGIDPILRRRFWDRFRELRDDGRTLVVTTQYVGEAADCDHVALLSEGRLLRVGTPTELKRAAFGGELVEFETAERLTDEQLADVTRLDGVRGDPRIVGRQRVQLLVEDGGNVLPTLVARLRDDGHEVVDTEEVEVSWDEVFVRLVEAGDDERAEDARPDERAEDACPDDARPDDARPDDEDGDGGAPPPPAPGTPSHDPPPRPPPTGEEAVRE